jgi:hypothetical protein
MRIMAERGKFVPSCSKGARKRSQNVGGALAQAVARRATHVVVAVHVRRVRHAPVQSLDVVVEQARDLKKEEEEAG